MSGKLAVNDRLAVTEDQYKEPARIVAEEIARQVAFHIEDMFPEAVQAASSTFLLSVKGCIIEIMALKNRHKFYANIGDWLKQNAKHRRTIRKLKKAKTIDEVIAVLDERR